MLEGELFCNPFFLSSFPFFFFLFEKKCLITLSEKGMEMSAIYLPQRVTVLLCSALGGGGL